MPANTSDEFTDILKHIYGPRDMAEGTYAQVCALVEALRGKRYNDRTYKKLAERLGCKVRRRNLLREMLYRRNPFFDFLDGTYVAPPPDPIEEYDVEQTQAHKGGRRKWYER